MNTSTQKYAIWIFAFSAFFFLGINHTSGQNLLDFIDKCNYCKGKVKKIKTRQKADIKDSRSPYIYKTDEYNQSEQLIKTEISVESKLSKVIEYFYKDSMVLYEKHTIPQEEEYFLIYQYYHKKIPTTIIKATTDLQMINYSKLEYTKDLVPVYLKLYNLLGELQEKKSVEYFSKNQIVIRSFNAKTQFSFLNKYELLCKFNKPRKLRKKDFKDAITRPINLEIKNDLVRVVKAVQTENKERVQIEELDYDEYGNWVSKKTFELKNNKNKRRLIKEIRREIEYF